MDFRLELMIRTTWLAKSSPCLRMLSFAKRWGNEDGLPSCNHTRGPLARRSSNSSTITLLDKRHWLHEYVRISKDKVTLYSL